MNESAVAQWLEKLLVPQVFPAFEHIMKSMQGVPDTRFGDGATAARRAVLGICRRGQRGIQPVSHLANQSVGGGQRWTATLQVRGQVVGVGTASKIAAAREIALDE
jgi:hypothetical protein